MALHKSVFAWPQADGKLKLSPCLLSCLQGELDAMRQVETQLAEKQACIEEEVRSPLPEMMVQPLSRPGSPGAAVGLEQGGEGVKALRDEMHHHMARLKRESEASDAQIRSDLVSLDQQLQVVSPTGQHGSPLRSLTSTLQPELIITCITTLPASSPPGDKAKAMDVMDVSELGEQIGTPPPPPCLEGLEGLEERGRGDLHASLPLRLDSFEGILQSLVARQVRARKRDTHTINNLPLTLPLLPACLPSFLPS